MMDQGRRAFVVTPHALLGLAAIVFGLLLTADNLQLIVADRILRYWPVALLIGGLALVVQPAERSGHRLIGWILVGLGAWMSAAVMFGLRVRIWDWWPLVFVAIGVSLVLRARGGPYGESSDPQTTTAVAFWSGVQRRISSPAFRRAELTAVMGGIEVDLRQARTAAGEAVIDVFVLWGGVEITVPPDWSVTNAANVVMGGIEDKSSGLRDATNHLTIRGLVLMGGVEVKT